MAREPFNPNLVRGPAPPRVAADAQLTVSQVTSLVKAAIETALPPTVYVVGEISNYKLHSSGHVYFTLKDKASELACVMWRSSSTNVKFTPSDGMEVIATGQVTVFERSGRYQLMVRKLEPRGIGALELAFRQLCEKLAAEGLFDKARKRPLPRFPQRIAIVTSPTGAAIADMLRTIERRFPCMEVLVYPVRVQGPGAANEISHAIRRINFYREKLGGVDVIIVGRGGGSLEDLWAFNEEVVARAIVASQIPVVSAVGHEVDITVSDLVADVRAATPTAAAELVAPMLAEILVGVDALSVRLLRNVHHRLTLGQSNLTGLSRRSIFREPVLQIRKREQVIDEWTNRTHRALVAKLQAARRTLDRIEPIVQRIAPHAYLLRTSLRLRDADHKLRSAAFRRLSAMERLLSRTEQTMERSSPQERISRGIARIEQLAQLLPKSGLHRVALLQSSTEGQQQRLLALSYRSVLERGFSITRSKKSREIIRSIQDVKDRQRLITELSDGQFESESLNIRQKELFDEP